MWGMYAVMAVCMYICSWDCRVAAVDSSSASAAAVGIGHEQVGACKVNNIDRKCIYTGQEKNVCTTYEKPLDRFPFLITTIWMIISRHAKETRKQRISYCTGGFEMGLDVLKWQEVTKELEKKV